MPQILDDIPDDYLKAIGMVTVRWNHLEQIVNLFLIYLLGKEIFEHRPHIVFAHMAFPQKLDVLTALAEEVIKTHQLANLGGFKTDVLPILKRAQSGRNSVIHSMWGTNEGRVTRANLSARGSLKFTWTVATLKEIEDVGKLIEQARQKLSDLASPEWKESIRARKEGKK